MKLRQRIVLSVGGSLVLFSLITFYMLSRPLHTKTDDHEKILQQIIRTSGENNINVNLAHLQFPRKDLDKSNSTSVEDVTSKQIADRNKQLLAKIKKQKEYFRFVASKPEFAIFDNLYEETQVKTQEAANEKVINIQLDKHFEGFEQMSANEIKQVLASHRKSHRRKSKKLDIISEYHVSSERSALTSWERFYLGISQHELYQDEDSAIDDLLRDMASLPIVDTIQKKGGTQIKLIMTFKNDGQALFKPRRFGRDYEANPNHFYFSDFERHTAEIASFHLDRVLGFRRVPPTSGRIVNSSSEVQAICDSKLGKTFFISPAGNLCFFGKCTYYCDTGHAICANKDLLEGSLMVFLPPDSVVPRTQWRHPWRRSYSKWKKAEWETKPDYCRTVVRDPLYSMRGNTRKRLLDIMDLAVFDFLTGNMDRHHYETLDPFENDTAPIHWDNGRGFGKAHHDEMSILIPITQCCLIRHSTLQKLILLHTGPVQLSDLMRSSLQEDKLNYDPILPEPQLAALDRRVDIILDTIHNCVMEKGISSVSRDDGF